MMTNMELNNSPFNSLPADVSKKLGKIKFSQTRPKCDRKFYVDSEDVMVVLSRLPYGTWRRLKAVHFNDKSHGARVLGYVTKGHREISLCALPPRISLARFLDRCQSPKKFGAKRGSQWPEIAIRKYLLYDVFLHELGHLQIVDEKAKDARHKFANETLAQSFADHWRMILWRDHYSHEDAVHNTPYKLQS